MRHLLDMLSFQPSHLIDHLVYIAIALVTVIGCIKCLIPLWTTTIAMRRAIRRLHDEDSTMRERPVWQEPRFLGRRLRGCWLRFLQNAEQLDRRGLPCNVEDYVNDDTVTHGPGNAQLAELIPSLLTSLGILGTFLGMTQGLSGLDVTTTDQMMKGIQNLLSGMQFAFGTSVAGVACSLAFNMLNRISQGSSYRAIDDFTEAFTSLAMQRPLDNDVQLICQNQDRNHLLSTVSDAVQTVPGRMEQAVSGALLPIAHSMDQFLLGATKSQIDGVGRVVDHFVDQMNLSLNGQFLLLGKTLTEINQNQAASIGQVQNSLSAVDGLLDDVSRMHQISDSLLQQFERYISELSLARMRDEGFEKNASSLLDSMQKNTREQAHTLDAITQMQKEIMRETEAFEKISRSSLSSMESQQLRLQEAVSRLSGSYTSLTQEAVDSLSHSLSQLEKDMHAILQTLSDALPHMSENRDVESISAMQKTLSQMQSSVNSIASLLSKDGEVR
ncbi:MAG: hypothetical protein IJ246_09475 [Clostridia bacterium]|nr:hypothetical protein [Clostridia bacterium]